MEEGEQALKDINQKNGFGWDDADLAYYYNLFANILKRNPTNVECFDLSQSNSEHSRHWFFKVFCSCLFCSLLFSLFYNHPRAKWSLMVKSSPILSLNW